MDKSIRRLERALAGAGQLEEFVVETVARFNTAGKRRVFLMARFHMECEEKIFGPRGRQVAIKYLSDAFILEMVKGHKLRNRHRRWVQGYIRGTDRRVDDVILEEAEYRWLKTDALLRWEELRDGGCGERSAIASQVCTEECLETI